MKTKIRDYGTAHATMEKLFPSGMYLVELWSETGRVDRVRVDDYRAALDYYRDFSKIARNIASGVTAA